MVQKGIINKRDIVPGTTIYTFSTGENTRVTRKGDKITFFKCTCNEKYCAHLAAILFTFQKDILGKLTGDEKMPLKKSENLFSKYRKVIKQKQDEVIKNNGDAKSFLNEIIKLLKPRKDSFYITLAIFCEFNTKAFHVHEDLSELCRQKLKDWLRSHLGKEKVNALQQAALLLVSSPNYFSRGTYSFLVPYTARFTHEISFINEMKEKLEKRKTRQHSLTGLDDKTIVMNHLLIGEERITGKKIAISHKTAEFYIACAEHYLLEEKPVNASKVLKEGYTRLSKKRPLIFIGYLERAARLAAEINDAKTELVFTRELFIREIFLTPFYYERIKTLLDPHKQKLFVDEIIAGIKSQPESFDKHYHLLVSQERYNDAMDLIGAHSNKFRYANEVVLLMNPVTEKALAIYIKQFCNAILAAPETHFQKRILQNALVFLNRLEVKRRIAVMQKILSALPQHGYIYQQVSALISANLPA